MSTQRGQGWGRNDDLGTFAPIGGSSGAKELIRLPSDADKLAPIAGTLLRGRTREKLRGYYGLAASLAGDHKPSQAFIINMTAAGLGQEGFARNEFMMGLVGMLVPTSMPAYHAGNDGQGYAGSGNGRNQRRRDRKQEDDE